jgi:hypothetical protein
MPANNSIRFQQPNSYQLRQLHRLTLKLGYDNVPKPTTRGTAEDLLHRLDREVDARAGAVAPPTISQLRFINKLASHDDHAPETFDAADALIKQYLAPSPDQLATIGQLADELSHANIPFPETARFAGKLIHRLIMEREDTLGYKPATPGQKAILITLAEEQGRAPYAEPRTFAQADAKIKQVTAAMAARRAADQEGAAA